MSEPAVKQDKFESASCLPADSKAIQKTDHRELIFHIKKGNNYSFLKLPDHDVTWYNIPLGRLSPRKSNKETKNENVLIPVIPRVYTAAHPDDEFSEYPSSPGFIYVFRDGYLWRELGVTSHGSFRDVNLKTHQNTDWRPVSAGGDDRILLPYKVNGKEADIEMCYSTVQWSWAYINRMGGMKKTDFRLKKDGSTQLATNLNVSKDDSKKLREIRMQKVILDGTEVSLKANNLKDNSASVKDAAEYPFLYHTAAHDKSGLKIVTLKDPIGVARRLHAEMTNEIGQLDLFINSLRGLVDEKGEVIENPEAIKNKAKRKTYTDKASMFYMAAYLSSYLYSSVDLNMDPDTWKTLTKEQKKAVEKRKDWREHINKEELFETLQIKKIEEYIERISTKKAMLIHYLEDGNVPSDAKIERLIPKNSCTFSVALKDCFASGKRGYLQAMEIINDLLVFLTAHPAGNAKGLLLDQGFHDMIELENPSEDFILRLHGAHPTEKHELSLCQFPELEKATNDKPFPYKVKVTKPGETDFNTTAFLAWSKNEDKGDDIFKVQDETWLAVQTGRRIAQVLNSRATTLAHNTFKSKRRVDNAIKTQLENRNKVVATRLKLAESNVSKYEKELAAARKKLKSASTDLVAINQDINNLNKQKIATDKHHNDKQKVINDKHAKEEIQLKTKKIRSTIEFKTAKREFRKAISNLKEVKEEIVGLLRRLKELEKIKSNKAIKFSDLSGGHIKAVATVSAMHINDDLKKAGARLRVILISMEDLAAGKLPESTLRLNHHLFSQTHTNVATAIKELTDTNARNLTVLSPEGTPIGHVRMDSAMEMRRSAELALDMLDGNNKSNSSMKQANKQVKSQQHKILVLAFDVNDAEHANATNQNETQRAKTQASIDKTKQSKDASAKQSQADIDAANKKIANSTAKLNTAKDSQNFFQKKLNEYTEMLSKKFNWDPTVANKWNVRFNSTVMIFEMVNVGYTLDTYMKNKTAKNLAYLGSAALDLTATVAVITELKFIAKYGQFSAAQQSYIGWVAAGKQGTKPISALKLIRFAGVSKWALGLNVAAGVISSILSAEDALVAAQRGDNIGSLGNSLMSLGFLLPVIAPLIGGGPLAILGFVIIAIGAFIIWWFHKDAMEYWLINGPWGGDKKQRFGEGIKKHGFIFKDDNEYYHWQQDVQYAQLALMNINMSPKVLIWKHHWPNYHVRGNFLEVCIMAPNVALDDLECIIEMRKVTTDGSKPIWTKVNLTSKSSKPSTNNLGIDYDKLWDDVKFLPLPDKQGYRLIFYSEKNFKHFIKADPYASFRFRARVRIWPNGKNKHLFPGGTVPYSLPNPDRKLDGKKKKKATEYVVSVSARLSEHWDLGKYAGRPHGGTRHDKGIVFPKYLNNTAMQYLRSD